MSPLVWKKLPPADLEAFRSFLEGLPAGGRPRYGMLGVRASWWSRLGGPTRLFVVLLSGGRFALSQRSFRRGRELSRREYPVAALRSLTVRRGPLLESARFRFADGYSVRVGGLPRRQSRPLERYLAGEEEALEAARLSPEQLTNFHQAMAAVGLLSRSAAGSTEGGAPRS